LPKCEASAGELLSTSERSRRSARWRQPFICLRPRLWPEPPAHCVCASYSASASLPHEKPWLIDGIGSTHFPITTGNPEVQKWFDQGNTLLHCFWDYEAARAFRWCIKLDPDCAMAYWGLARAIDDDKRAAAVLTEAVKRKSRASARERLYIEAWEALWRNGKTDAVAWRRALKAICARFPDDPEAKCLAVFSDLTGEERAEHERLLQQALAHEPDHIGAHHYRVHVWDGSTQAAMVLDSCAALPRIAPASAHIQHMPGHIYCKLGMWHEAGIAMDTAARVGTRYLEDRMMMPFDDWNYSHNLSYRCFVQEQLGMPGAAAAGARELLAAPRDPGLNNADDPISAWSAGIGALMGVFVKYDCWDDILGGAIPWRETLPDRVWKAYCETLAHLGKGDVENARKTFAAHSALAGGVRKNGDEWIQKLHPIQSLELRARLEIAAGKAQRGIALLTEAAKQEAAFRHDHSDPPIYPVCLDDALGETCLALERPAQAVAAFNRALATMANDGFALAGLVEANRALGKMDSARDALSRLLFVWADAEPHLKPLERAKSAGLIAEPRDNSPSTQRDYRKVLAESGGASPWEPCAAPPLDAIDGGGRPVTLEEFRGKNILLVFAKSKAGMKALTTLQKSDGAFAQLNTRLLAITSDPRDTSPNLLRDESAGNARRFLAYDDFTDTALDATILIDVNGKIRWLHRGAFSDVDFLQTEIQRTCAEKKGG